MNQKIDKEPLFKTSLEIDNEPRYKIAFQVPSIDTVLRGGIRLQGLTEISGEAGCGKSQLAMHLCLTAQLPVKMGGMDKKTLYINTEGPLVTERVLEMARHLIEKHDLDVSTTKMLENFIYFSVFDYEDLLQLLEVRLLKLLEMEPIGLIVIDSVAAVFRIHAQYINRAKNMRTLVTTLQRLGKKYNFAVVCINQVRNTIDSMEASPALGLAWANLVTTRLQIFKEESLVDKNGEVMQKRTLRVTWAPNLPSDEATFYITRAGIA